MQLKNHIPTEFVFQLFSLLIAVIIVHAFYVAVVRPNADAIIEEQTILIEEDSDYVPERSFFIIIRDFEQEACFVLMLWAFSILGYKAYSAARERTLLQQNLVPITEGMRILPEDTREYARQIQALPEDEKSMLLPRVKTRSGMSA